MKHLLLLAILTLITSGFLPSPAFGTWGSSGGGEIIGDFQNPWWLRNVKKIKYCIVVDPESISVSSEKLPAMIENAFQYWKKEFTGTFPIVNLDKLIPSKAGVGQQEFVLSDCDADTDLRFQFGYGSLTEIQKKKVPHIDRYIGVVIRTDFDEVNLRGKGFIYIGSDQGPHAIPDENSSFVQHPWSLPLPLPLVLMHELGHVFGVPHSDSPNDTIMYFRLPELVLHKVFAPGSNVVNLLEQFPANFLPPTRFFHCNTDNQGPLSPEVLNYFGAPSDSECLDFRLGGPQGDIQIYSRKLHRKTDSGDRLLGIIEKLNYKIDDSDPRGAILIRMNPKQAVFSASEFSSKYPYIPALFILNITATGGFFHSTGISPQIEHPIMMSLKPKGHFFYSVKDGAIVEIAEGYNLPAPEF